MNESSSYRATTVQPRFVQRSMTRRCTSGPLRTHPTGGRFQWHSTSSPPGSRDSMIRPVRADNCAALRK